MSPAEFREARGALGLSAHKLSLLLGVHPRTIQRWADGSQDVPGPAAFAISQLKEREPDLPTANCRTADCQN